MGNGSPKPALEHPQKIPVKNLFYFLFCKTLLKESVPKYRVRGSIGEDRIFCAVKIRAQANGVHACHFLQRQRMLQEFLQLLRKGKGNGLR